MLFDTHDGSGHDNMEGEATCGFQEVKYIY